MPVASRAFHWQPVRRPRRLNDVEDAVGAGAVRNAGPPAAEAVGVHVLGYQGFRHGPEFVRWDVAAWCLSLSSLHRYKRNRSY